MSSRHRKVIVNDREKRRDVVDQALAALPGLSLGQLNANLQLRHCDSGHCDVVVIVDDVVKTGVRPFRVDEEGRV
ncbi:MAG: hypothetical protein WCA31_07765 [Acidimicrobiales bacterium]